MARNSQSQSQPDIKFTDEGAIKVLINNAVMPLQKQINQLSERLEELSKAPENEKEQIILRYERDISQLKQQIEELSDLLITSEDIDILRDALLLGDSEGSQIKQHIYRFLRLIGVTDVSAYNFGTNNNQKMNFDNIKRYNNDEP